MSRLPSTSRIGAPTAALAVAIAFLVACSDDEPLSIDQAAEVDTSSVAAASLSGTADATFDGVTATTSGVTCTNEDRLVVSPIVSDTFTLTVDGDPATGDWNVGVTQPGEPVVVWTAAESLVEVDGEVIAGNAQMQRADDPSVTAALAFVVDCCSGQSLRPAIIAFERLGASP